MSDAEAIEVTARLRASLAEEPMRGVDPRDVSVEWSRVASHTQSAYQVYVEAFIALGGVDEKGNPAGPFSRERALVARGRTAGEAGKMFIQWRYDPHAMARFTEVVQQHRVDVLAREAEAEEAKAGADRASRSKDNLRLWFERKFHAMAQRYNAEKLARRLQ